MKKWIKQKIRKPSSQGSLDKENGAVNLKEDSTCSSTSTGGYYGTPLDGITPGSQGSVTPNGDIAEVVKALETGGRHEIDAALKLVLKYSHENMRLFIDDGGMQLLLKLLAKKRSQELVLDVLLTLFESGLDWRGAFDDEHGTDLLVKVMLGNSQKSTKRVAVRVVPHLLETEDSRKLFHEADGIKALTRALDWGGEKCRALAAKGLAAMARARDVYQNEIVASGGLARLRNLCNSGQPSAVACLNAIADVTTNNATAQQEMSTTAWVPIMYILTSDDSEMKEAVARVLSSVSADSECRFSICVDNGVRRMMGCLDSGETEAELWILRALNNLCEESRGLRDVMNGLPSVVKVLSDGIPACQLEAIRCLNMAVKHNKSFQSTTNMVHSLVGILRVEDLEGACEAATLLSAVVISGELRAQLINSGGIQALIDLLVAHVNGREAVVDALAKLSHDRFAANQILSQGGMGPLVAFLSEAPLNGKLLILECLSNLGKFGGNGLEVCDGGPEDPLRDSPLTMKATLQKLIKLLGSFDNKVICETAICLANLLQDRPLLQTWVLDEGILPKLLEMLDWGLKRLPALTVLSMLSHREECKASFNSIETLISMLPQGNLGMKRSIARLVGDLVTDKEVADRVMNCPAHQELIKLLDSSATTEAIRALTSIAMHSPSLRTTLASHAYISKVVLRLRGLELSEMADAARYIAVVVQQSVSNQNRVAHCAGIHPLVSLLTLPHSKCKAMSAFALAALVEENSSNQRAVANAGAIPRLAIQLSDEDEECRLEAAHALSHLTFQNSSNQLKLANADPREALLALLEGSSTGAKSHVGKIFSNLAQSTDPQLFGLRRSSIEPLVRMLSLEEDKCQEAAAGYLANLAFCEAEQRMIRNAGGIPPLVNLVRCGQPPTQKQAARALANISCQDAHLAEIVEEGGIPVLVDLLESTYPGNRKQAAGALANLACNNAVNSQLIIEAQGVQKLLALSSEKGDSCRVQGIRAIRNLACSPENQEALINAGALPILTSLLKEEEGDQPDFRRKLIKAVVALVADDEATQLSLLDKDMVETLLAALRHNGDQEVENEVKRALVKLACGVDNEEAAHSAIQAARVRCVSSILAVGSTETAEDAENLQGPFFGEEDNFEGIPRHFLCPITHELMEDPVIAADGHTYERAAIAAWFNNKTTSPMTGLKLTSWQLCPNRLVVSMIQEFQGKRQREDVK